MAQTKIVPALINRQINVNPRKGAPKDAWENLKTWCERHNVPISSVFNAILPALYNCIITFTHQKNENTLLCTMNFGEVEIIVRKPRRTAAQYMRDYRASHLIP